ncbi:hypothetical protein [Geomicrobium sediminis]|uniref:Uncharacterized protein n=1 Tax=Geomicrobium sediminis TaxID=1347788 RepID=A0ABS2PEJ9_9BACL|nr:hypothetical protein [Geomicrobium sediminis]MBM7633843.1 hypothetical protein [Geomicrobium sediminis]
MNVIIPIVTSFGGVILGDYLSKKNSAKHEQKFLKKGILIEKLQLGLDEYSKISRSISRIDLLVKKLHFNGIEFDEFRLSKLEHESDIANSCRKLSINTPILTSYEKQYDEFIEKYIVASNMMYDTYIEKNKNKKFYKDKVFNYNQITEEYKELLEYISGIQKQMSNDLKEQLK